MSERKDKTTKSLAGKRFLSKKFKKTVPVVEEVDGVGVARGDEAGDAGDEAAEDGAARVGDGAGGDGSARRGGAG